MREEDSGWTWCPCSWMLEGLFAARDRQGGLGGKVREERERGAVCTGVPEGDVTHARGTVNASAIRQTHEPPCPHLLYLERTEFPHCHPCSRFSPPPILPSADACNSPMLNATFTSLHLRGALHTRFPAATPACLRENLPFPPILRATICEQFMHLVCLRAFIARVHALYRLVSIMRRGRKGWIAGRAGQRGRIGRPPRRKE